LLVLDHVMGWSLVLMEASSFRTYQSTRKGENKRKLTTIVGGVHIRNSLVGVRPTNPV
jgi:hypothetical protein